MGLQLDRVTADTAVLADVLRSSPSAGIGCYDRWTVVELAGHVGQIHRWVTGIVTERSTERPTTPYATPPAPGELANWLVAGAADLVAVLAAADPHDTVWTISRSVRDVGFWRQRMVLETALHRWDAEDAAGDAATVDDEVALAGVAETLDVYLAQRLEGHDVGGSGQRVLLVPDGSSGWTATLRPDGFDVAPGVGEADAVVRGTALDLWLLLTCRRGLDDVVVEGDQEAAELAVAAARMVPGPAG